VIDYLIASVNDEVILSLKCQHQKSAHSTHIVKTVEPSNFVERNKIVLGFLLNYPWTIR